MAIKLPIRGTGSQTIPHFKADTFWNKAVQHIYCLYGQIGLGCVIYKVKGHKHYVGLWPLITLGSCQAKNGYQNNKYGIETYGTLNKL